MTKKRLDFFLEFIIWFFFVLETSLLAWKYLQIWPKSANKLEISTSTSLNPVILYELDLVLFTMKYDKSALSWENFIEMGSFSPWKFFLRAFLKSLRLLEEPKGGECERNQREREREFQNLKLKIKKNFIRRNEWLNSKTN